MSSQIETVTEACRLIARQVRDSYRQLHVHYIIHHSGQRREALAMAAQEILQHPAAETALHMMQKVRRSEDSAMIGTAVARRRMFFGLASQDTVLSLCTINLEQFSSIKDARRYAWHLAWHAIDALHYHAHPDNRSNRNSDTIMRRRNAIEMAGANLRADTFSATVSALNGDLSAIRGLALMRGTNALQTRSLHNPEFYPYIMAKDATDFAVQDALRRSLPKKRFLPAALKIADHIGKTIDDNTLRQWLTFSEPAQDMAWRGFSPPDILAAAINTSDDTSVRSTGYMVSEITGIAPGAITGGDSYSPFADDAFNEKLHEKSVLATFEDAIGQGLRQRSADPFIHAANRQNESLTEGNILGWCAAAMQAAGRAFDRALASGSEPEKLARTEFDGERQAIAWSDLRNIGKHVVHEQRSGNIVTMSRLEHLCGDDKAFASIRKAILSTMRDPSYQRRLDAGREAAPEMAPAAAPAMAPASPAPASSAPVRAAAPSGMGMGRAAGGVVRTAGAVQEDSTPPADQATGKDRTDGSGV